MRAGSVAHNLARVVPWTIAFVPLFARAAPTTLEGFIELLTSLVLSLIPIAAAIALLVFFWGGAQFILNAGNEQKRSEGKIKLFWGVVILFVIVSLGALLQIITVSLLSSTTTNSGGISSNESENCYTADTIRICEASL